MSTWSRIAALPVRIDSLWFERLSRLRPGKPRVTTQVYLAGAGHVGIGEDVSPQGDDHNALHVNAPDLNVTGTWTLNSFSEHLSCVDHWSSPPAWTAMRRWRTWAFEAAAMDLALRQAGMTIFDAIARPQHDVHFVSSLSLGPLPSTDTLVKRQAYYPTLRFKLDVTSTWHRSLITELAMSGHVDILDFKGRYAGSTFQTALLEIYREVVTIVPSALIEDPHDDGRVHAILQAHHGRVTYDAYIDDLADLQLAPSRPVGVNVKPCRFGTWHRLLDFYDDCSTRDDLLLYGGGMDELGAGRGQLQILAAAFHANSPNDVAPVGYNDPEPVRGLPTSPMDLGDASGFQTRASPP